MGRGRATADEAYEVAFAREQGKIDARRRARAARTGQEPGGCMTLGLGCAGLLFVGVVCMGLVSLIGGGLGDERAATLPATRPTPAPAKQPGPAAAPDQVRELAPPPRPVVQVVLAGSKAKPVVLGREPGHVAEYLAADTAAAGAKGIYRAAAMLRDSDAFLIEETTPVTVVSGPTNGFTQIKPTAGPHAGKVLYARDGDLTRDPG